MKDATARKRIMSLNVVAGDAICFKVAIILYFSSFAVAFDAMVGVVYEFDKC